MSVSFYVVKPITGWVIECSCGAARLEQMFATHAEALDVFVMDAAPVCGDEFCAAYRHAIVAAPDEADAFECNMSNRNAAGVLDVLGYGEAVAAGDMCGQIDAEGLLGRIMMALALSPADEGLPVVQTGNVIDCGRPAGYMQDRLGDLTRLAEHAQTRNLTIAWS